MINLQYLATQIFPVYMQSLTQNVPNEIEGIAYIGDQKIAVFYSSSGGKDRTPLETEDSRIQIFHVEDDPRNTNLLSEVMIAGLGHVNSAGYCKENDELFVCKSAYTPIAKPDSIKYSNEISVLKTKPFITKTRDIACKLNEKSIFVNLVSYDKIRHKLYGVIRIKDYSELIEIDPNNGKSTQVLKFGKIAHGYFQSSQGLAVRDGIVYWQTGTPRCISIYSIDEQKLIQVINLPVSDCYGHIIKYPQDIDYDENGVFYQSSHARDAKISYGATEGTWRYNYICRFDPERDIMANVFDSNDTSVITKKEAHTIYVDSKFEGIYQNGTKSFPFKSLTEAFYSIKYCKHRKNIVEVLSCGSIDKWVLLNGIRCTVTGSDLVMNGLALRNCDIIFTKPVQLLGENFNKRVLYIVGSKVIFAGHLSVAMKETGEMSYIENSDVMITKGCQFLSNPSSIGLNCVNSVIRGMLVDSSNNETTKKFIFDNTELTRSAITKTNYDIVLKNWNKIRLPIRNDSKISVDKNASFYVKAILRIIWPGNGSTYRFFESNSRLFSGESKFKIFVMTWFGVIGIVLDSQLQLTDYKIAVVYNPQKIDLTGFSYKLEELIIE